MKLDVLKQNLQTIKTQRPELYKESMELSIPLFILHKRIYEAGNNYLLAEYDLNQTDLDVLGALYARADLDYTLSPTALYEIMLFSSGGMTKVLKKLEKRELISRLENPCDKRSKLVQLTPKGQELTAKALAHLINAEDSVFSKLSKEEQALFKTLLHKTLS